MMLDYYYDSCLYMYNKLEKEKGNMYAYNNLHNLDIMELVGYFLKYHSYDPKRFVNIYLKENYIELNKANQVLVILDNYKRR